MGGCAAPFCNNSSRKGYIMKVFPRDPQRRALWERNVPRENWTATNNSCLCEMHFAPEMWERRRDG
ncbi:THAP domain-containing protein 10-like, partial [Temnothorax curvispinosus]